LDVEEYNRRAWNGLVDRGNEWTVPFPPERIEAARAGDWSIALTPARPVPASWFPDTHPSLAGVRALCLAGGGGQQGPVLAAAGAEVTVFDASERQLDRDREVAERDGLDIETVRGDMRDLGRFDDGSFDLVVHPCSTSFVPDVRPVWREAARVLAPGGVLLSGSVHPFDYVFDEAAVERGELVVRHALPYSDLASLTDEERADLVRRGEPFVFSHSLEDLIAGQIEAGLRLEDLYEDRWPGKPLARYAPSFLATLARKPPIPASAP